MKAERNEHFVETMYVDCFWGKLFSCCLNGSDAFPFHGDANHTLIRLHADNIVSQLCSFFYALC